MKYTTLTLCASLLMALAVPVQAAGDPKAGKLKTSMCAGCHGIPGWRTSYPAVYSVPLLGGQHAEYIVAALKANEQYVEYVVYPDEGHGFLKMDNLIDAEERRVDFLARLLDAER